MAGIWFRTWVGVWVGLMKVGQATGCGFIRFIMLVCLLLYEFKFSIIKLKNRRTAIFWHVTSTFTSFHFPAASFNSGKAGKLWTQNPVCTEAQLPGVPCRPVQVVLPLGSGHHCPAATQAGHGASSRRVSGRYCWPRDYQNYFSNWKDWQADLDHRL